MAAAAERKHVLLAGDLKRALWHCFFSALWAQAPMLSSKFLSNVLSGVWKV